MVLRLDSRKVQLNIPDIVVSGMRKVSQYGFTETPHGLPFLLEKIIRLAAAARLVDIVLHLFLRESALLISILCFIVCRIVEHHSYDKKILRSKATT